MQSNGQGRREIREFSTCDVFRCAVSWSGLSASKDRPTSTARYIYTIRNSNAFSLLRNLWRRKLIAGVWRNLGEWAVLHAGLGPEPNQLEQRILFQQIALAAQECGALTGSPSSQLRGSMPF